MDGNKRLINRDISWLAFNYRVLDEAKDKSLPLYERVKFLAIYSSNLEEYYKIRVAYYRNLIDLPESNKKILKANPAKILSEITNIVGYQLLEFSKIYDAILIELKENNIFLYQGEEFPAVHQEFINNYFSTEVLPHIQPVLLEK